MIVNFTINMNDMIRTEFLWSLFSHVLALANAHEAAEPRNTKIDEVRECLKDARNFINEAEDLFEHSAAVIEIGRAYEALTGDPSLRERGRELSKELCESTRIGAVA
ncbi:MAG: hypothetical protein ACTHOC_12710 [Luteimonas sp.]